MAIKRYIADADNTITNAFKENLTTRGTTGNMGESDVMEVFSIYAQANSSSVELTRLLAQFPVSYITADRATGAVPASGNVNFFLKLSNAVHAETLPTQFNLTIQPVSRSWIEGTGLDMEEYKDIGASNWLSASTSVLWTTEGGDYLTSSNYNAYFDNGTEDLEVDITGLVEEWAAGTIPNYGVGVHLSSSEETATRSYYTKKFFARGSEFFYKRPYIEARWDSSIRDDRNDFVISSSLLPAEDNLNNLYLYNKFRGKFVNIPAVGTGSIYVSMYSGTTGPIGARLPLQNSVFVVTGGYVSTGIYSASVAVDTPVKYVFDVWHDDSGSTPNEFFTGSTINTITYNASIDDEPNVYIIKITNLKSEYSTQETARLRMYARTKDWSPTVYTISSGEIENTTINDIYYKLTRTSDGFEVIPFGTGSLNHTRLSYDDKGNYFDFDMSMLQADYEYSWSFLVKEYGEYKEQPEVFKFRVG